MTDSTIPNAAEFTKAHQEAMYAAYQNAYHKECNDMFVKFRASLVLATNSSTTNATASSDIADPFEFRYSSDHNTLMQCPQMDRVRAAGYHVDLKSRYCYPENSYWYEYIIAVPPPTVSTTTFGQQLCTKIATYFRS